MSSSERLLGLILFQIRSTAGELLQSNERTDPSDSLCNLFYNRQSERKALQKRRAERHTLLRAASPLDSGRGAYGIIALRLHAYDSRRGTLPKEAPQNEQSAHIMRQPAPSKTTSMIAAILL